MKKINYYHFVRILILSLISMNGLQAQLAQLYPHDSLIESDQDVIFADMFEQTDIDSMINASGYQTNTPLAHINFDPSVPPGSHGTQSLKLTTLETSAASNDPNEDANLLKKFAVGINDEVYVRYYVKYNSQHTFHHSGVWLGGTDAANNCWPCNIPGRTIPTSGDSAFVVGSEIRGNANMSASANSTFGFYNYWMDMRPFTTGANAGKYFGNEFISSDPTANLDMDAWNCIEVMLKLNNPVDNQSGELKLWINGNLVAHYGPGFPNGTWSEAHFIEGAGSPFEGFRWRSNPQVLMNYVWIKNYATANANYPSDNDVLYDHFVVAKKYIGPISELPVAGLQKLGNSSDAILLYPNPANQRVYFSQKVDQLSVYEATGQKIAEAKNVSLVDLSDLPEGIYFLQLNESFHRLMVRH